MPKQILRLLVAFGVLITAFLIVRSIIIPKSFGELGHYRKDAVTDIANQVIKYAGQDVCIECHDDIGDTKSKGHHRNLSCEVCHGAAANHADAPDEFAPIIPNKRAQCPVCHEFLASRPTGFPQINTEAHNPVKPCVECHDPHAPNPPQTPKECSACHAEIAHTKDISHHAYVPCQRCHITPEEHKNNPRAELPSKPTTREQCGECHSNTIDSLRNVPKIDLKSHENKYVCWQCHYPHLPEGI